MFPHQGIQKYFMSTLKLHLQNILMMQWVMKKNILYYLIEIELDIKLLY